MTAEANWTLTHVKRWEDSMRATRRATLLMVLGIALCVGPAAGLAQNAATVPPTAGTQETTAPAVTTPVTPSSSSATCLGGCSSQQFNCQNTCIATINGTTVMPSITTQGTTSNPIQCQSNCSTQAAVCQRNCALR